MTWPIVASRLAYEVLLSAGQFFDEIEGHPLVNNLPPHLSA